jgi:hypothetical protein
MSAVNITMMHVHFPAYAMVFGTLMDESFIGVGLSALQHRPWMRQGFGGPEARLAAFAHAHASLTTSFR